MEDQKKNYNLVEKICFGIGALVLLGLISFLVYQMVQKKEGPPNLEITIVEDSTTASYDFKIDVENTGEETAEAANVRLSLYQDGQAVETGTVTFQYVPVKSTKTAWIVFHKKQKTGDSVVVSSITYVKP